VTTQITWHIYLEQRARVDIAAAVLYPSRKSGITSTDQDIHRNRDVVETLTSAKQAAVHEEELVLALLSLSLIKRTDTGTATLV